MCKPSLQEDFYFYLRKRLEETEEDRDVKIKRQQLCLKVPDRYTDTICRQMHLIPKTK